jgi:ketosteroid isomerase-like protein
MKNFIRRPGFSAFLVMVLLTTTSVFAKDWSAEQKNVLNCFKEYVAANLKGNVNEIMTYFHPKFTFWDYAQKLPANYDAMRKMMDDFFKYNKLIKFDGDPLEIQVEGNIAIMHLKYDESFSDSTGKEITASGPWTATMLKQDNKWVFLSWSWIAK